MWKVLFARAAQVDDRDRFACIQSFEQLFGLDSFAVKLLLQQLQPDELASDIQAQQGNYSDHQGTAHKMKDARNSHNGMAEKITGRHEGRDV